MKKFLKIFGITIASLLVVIYIGFLFVLPNVLDLNSCKSDIQKIALDNFGLNVNYENAKIITTPLLSIGIKTDSINVDLEDKSKVFSAENFEVKLALPSLLWKTVKITLIELNSPEINVDILNGKEYKILSAIEEAQKAQIEKQQEITTNPSNDNENEDNTIVVDNSTQNTDFDIKISEIIINNYSVKINDNKDSLKLSGDKLSASYSKSGFTIKTTANLLLNEETKVVANIDIDSFLPEFTNSDSSDNSDENQEFINPVKLYKEYNLKSDIVANLKIREKSEQLNIKGKLNIDGCSLSMKEYKLPDSFIHLDFNGDKIKINSSVYVAENEGLNIDGNLSHGKKSSCDLDIKSDKIFVKNLIYVAGSIMNALNIENDFAKMSGSGYIQANAKIKTDFKNINSEGKIIGRSIALLYPANNLSLKDFNADILFDDNQIKIQDTLGYINGSKFYAEGNIDKNSNTNIQITTDNIPLSPIFNSFATGDMKKTYAFDSGVINLKALIKGKLNNLSPSINGQINNLKIRDKVNNIIITNKNTDIDFSTDLKNYSGNINNSGLAVNLPDLMTNVTNDKMSVKFNEKDIDIDKSVFKINNVSTLNISGKIKDYIKKPDLNVKIDGSIQSKDIKNMCGKDLAPYIAANGSIKLKGDVSGDLEKQNIIVQVLSDNTNYVTPINLKEAVGKQSIIHIGVDLQNNTATLKDSGFYVRNSASVLSDDLNSNLNNTNKLISINGNISGLDKKVQTLNSIEVKIPQTVSAEITSMNKSKMLVKGSLNANGRLDNPVLTGSFNVDDVQMPQLLINAKSSTININGTDLKMNVSKLGLNGSYMDADLVGVLDFAPIFKITKLNITSDNINSDKALEVTVAADKFMQAQMAQTGTSQNSQSTSASSPQIPISIKNGYFDIKKATSGAMVFENLTGNFTLNSDVLNINGLKLDAYSGNVGGNVSMNLISGLIKAILNGEGINSNDLFTVAANVPNTVFGTMSFDTDISLKGATYEEQMKTLKGKANFSIKDGQFGTLGRFENFLLADNISSQAFLKTSIGTIINKVSPHNTAEYKELKGSMTFSDGYANISTITSEGKNMSLYLKGKYNLVNNFADMTVTGRISSEVYSLLGPLMQLNPMNIINQSNTLSTINAVAGTIFKNYTQTVTDSEKAKIPQLNPYQDDTTLFVVVLNGDVAKPQKVVKSFRWLNSSSEIQQAQNTLTPVEDIKETFKQIKDQKDETINQIKESIPQNKDEAVKKIFDFGKSLLIE